jgi:hypothetical protein
MQTMGGAGKDAPIIHPKFHKETPFQQSHEHFDQEKCVTSVMKGKFDR